VIDYNKPTAMMLGRWQPWHDGHQMLFEKSLEKTGQVIIMVRDTPRDDSNPFNFEDVKTRIEKVLSKFKGKFEIIKVPNITNICYGRGVGYKIEEIVLPKQIQEISATNIRKQLLK
jgi:phosphopantetheine adenylyltransferase